MFVDHKNFLKNCPVLPGVYQMLGSEGQILYVGKAQNLKSRVSSYFRETGLSIKTQALMKQVCDIKITVTQSDTEALILECSLIKEHRPRYNVLFRDDKSMPYILLTSSHAFPRLGIYRGKKDEKNRYFGPFPHSGVVYETLDLLQKVFHIRSCEDNEFKNRSRPCLLYQLKRCSAPCVGAITAEDYAIDVSRVVEFLSGKSEQLIETLRASMDQAAAKFDYEQAAYLRDQMMQLRSIQEKQYISGDKGDADVVAMEYQHGLAVVYCLKVREGQVLGGYAFFPAIPAESSDADILEAFLSQVYLSGDASDIPKQVILDRVFENKISFASALSEISGHKVELLDHVKTDRAKWLDIARLNAQQSLASKLASKATYQERYVALKESLNLQAFPNRIECFDISHTMGEAAVASCVVFDETGLLNKECRRYNIAGIVGGDDYAALRQVLLRRYTGMETMPDVILIDGGKGQLTQAREVFKALDVSPMVLGLAKGTTRKHGVETVYRETADGPVVIEVNALALHLLRQIDDKAHDWAISGHQKKREKTRNASRLDLIEGIGQQRRQQLLRFFGSLDVMRRASVEEIQKVPGISAALAERIYQNLHEKE